MLDNTFISTETICTNSAFPASDMVIETNYCLTKVALKSSMNSLIQLQKIGCNCNFLLLFYGLIFTNPGICQKIIAMSILKIKRFYKLKFDYYVDNMRGNVVVFHYY